MVSTVEVLRLDRAGQVCIGKQPAVNSVTAFDHGKGPMESSP